MGVRIVPTRPPPEPPQRRRRQEERQDGARGAAQPLAGRDGVGRVGGVVVERPVDEGLLSPARREVGPGQGQRDEDAEGEGGEAARDRESPAGAEGPRRPGESGQPCDRVVLEEAGRPEERAREQPSREPSCRLLVTKGHDGRGGGQQEQELGVHRQDVVADEGRPVDEEEEAGQEPPPVVTVEGRRGEGRQWDGQEHGEEPHRDEARPEDGRGEPVVGVEERRSPCRGAPRSSRPRTPRRGRPRPCRSRRCRATRTGRRG
jgi:hypothetical protein